MKILFLSVIASIISLVAFAQTNYQDLSLETAHNPAVYEYTLAYGDSLDIYLKITNVGENDLDTTEFIKFGVTGLPDNMSLVAEDSGTGAKVYLQPNDFFITHGIRLSNRYSQNEDETQEMCFFLKRDANSNFFTDTISANDTVCFKITYKADPNFTSINEPIKQSTFQVYPNPSSDFINIKLDNPASINRVYISNIMGQILYETDKFSDINDGRIDISHFPKGIYQINIIQNDALYSEKILIQ